MKQRKIERRERASARQTAYDKLSLDEKIEKVIPGSKIHQKLLRQKEDKTK